MSLGSYLQSKRLQQNRSILDVCEEAVVAPGTLRAYEQGRRVPSVAALNRLFVALGLDQERWIDTNVWEHPETKETYCLAYGPGGGGIKRSAMHQEEIDAIRLDAIARILTSDSETLKAIITLLKRS